MSIAKLRQAWEKHECVVFPPGMRGKVVAGCNLALLDSDVGGVVLTALETGGVLGIRMTALLEKCLQDLERVLPEVDSAAEDYFRELHTITRLLATIARPVSIG